MRVQKAAGGAHDINTDAIDEVALALLYLTLHDQYRAWKRFDWDVLNRLYQRGFIEDPVNKIKSVIVTEEGLRESSGSLTNISSF